jgi:hypothetical protein
LEERLRLRENFDRFNIAIHKEKEMADFRKWILALALLVLVMGSVAPASAQVQQAFACTANAAVPPTLRAEGLTELTGDIVLNCTGGTTTTSGTIPQANITVFLVNPITSRITDSGSNPETTEALLLIDDPSMENQTVCDTPTSGCTVDGATLGTGSGGNSTFNSPGVINVFQGVLTGPNAVTFLGVPIEPPSTPGSPARIYRITNVRTNASAYPTGPGGVTPVQAFISASGSTSVPINNPEPIVGFISQGLNASTAVGTTGFLQCQTYSEEGIATLTFTENFATAFKTRDAGEFDSESVNGGQDSPGAVYNTESGLIIQVPNGAWAGLADYGTRLKATFANLPHGVTLDVDTAAGDDCDSAVPTNCAVLVANTYGGGSDAVGDIPDFGGPTDSLSGTLPISYSTSSCDPATASSCNNGWAEAVWEVIGDNPFSIDSFSFDAYLSFTGAPGSPGTPEITSIPGTSQSNVNLSFAPTPNGGSFLASDGGLASDYYTIPRFVDNTTTTNLFTVSLCQTILLFPYVTDYPGFDTGIAISNTSADPLASVGLGSASPQSGACTVTFYGGVTGSDGTFTNTATNIGSNGVYDTITQNTFGTGEVGPGQTWAFSVSTADTSFGTDTFTGMVGYAIAVCNFQYAHGYSFVSDYGLRNFAAAYLALVIPDTNRTPNDHICSATGTDCLPTGEQLVH